MTQLAIASLSDQGRHRELNEDSVLADLPLVAVADGMGGHVAGEVASSTAVETLAGWKSKLLDSDSEDEAASLLRQAFAETNRTVFEKARDDSTLTGMGTTLTAAWIQGSKVTLAHVGDSRGYLLRNGSVRQVTEDQTKAQELVKQGVLSAEEAATSRDRHILMQAIGVEPDLEEVAISTLELYSGDRLLLATDGLSDMIPSNEQIAEILMRHPDPEQACRALVDEANEAGGHDNISVIVIDANGGSPPPVEAAAGDKEAGEDGSGPGETGELPPVSVPEEAEEAEEAEEPKSKRRLFRTAVVGALVLATFVAAVFLVRPTGPSYVLAARGNSVVLLDGRPGQGGQPARGEVIEIYREPRLDVFAIPAREALRGGIEVESRAEARRVIDTLPRLLGPQEATVPTPTPDATPEPTPDPGTGNGVTDP